MSSLYYCKIHVLRFIICYCTSIYNKYIIHFDLFIIITKLCFTKKKSFPLKHFQTQVFAAYNEIYYISKSSINYKHQTLKYGALLGVVKSW